MKRRGFLLSCAAAPYLASLTYVSEARDAKQALASSGLVYLSPVKSNGELSNCQAEVWFVMIGKDAYVVTDSDSWRATAPGKGLTRTRFWVGDLGVWKSADYTNLPSVMMDASIETDNAKQELALEQFGLKYRGPWSSWESRFRNGLADGSRTMLRYSFA